jgi:hypothetical protein
LVQTATFKGTCRIIRWCVNPSSPLTFKLFCTQYLGTTLEARSKPRNMYVDQYKLPICSINTSYFFLNTKPNEQINDQKKMRLGGLDDPRSSPIEDFFWCVQRESGCWRSKSRSRGYEGISNPMVPTAQRGRSTGCLLSLIWPKCLELHWAPHAWRLLDRIGFWGAHPCFYWPFGFRGKRDKAMLSIDIIGHVLRSMVKSEAENDRKTEFLRTSIRGSSLCGDKELVVAASASGSVA